MKSILHSFMIAAAMQAVISIGAKAAPLDPSIEVKDVIENVTEAVNEALDRPLIIITGNDTVYAQNADTVNNSRNITITLKTDSNNGYAVENAAYDPLNDIRILKLREKREALSVVLGIVIPCALIALAIIASFIFLFYRMRSRNKLIEKAIESNYQLPDSFFTGTFNSRQGSTDAKNFPTSTSQGDDQTDSNLPPLPTIPPVPPMNFVERKQFTNSIVWMIVGVFVFLFFACNGATGVGFLAGGIPFAIGASRCFTTIYLRRKQ